jgi:hypothetical protein
LVGVDPNIEAIQTYKFEGWNFDEQVDLSIIQTTRDLGRWVPAIIRGKYDPF